MGQLSYPLPEADPTSPKNLFRCNSVDASASLALETPSQEVISKGKGRDGTRPMPNGATAKPPRTHIPPKIKHL